MKRTMPKLLAVALALAMTLSFLPGGLQTAQAISGGVVISQVYGGGGNSGATYNADYVELYNPGTTTVSLAGWSIQYASATGTGNFGASASQLTELSGSIEPGHYWLVREASGTIGAALPYANVTDSTPINMSGSAGKVALVDQLTSLGCNGGSTSCSSDQMAHVIDLVGFGTGSSGANFYEGTGAAPTISAILADFRKLDGAQDTNDNKADFTAATPNPRNTIPPDAAPSVTSTVPANGAIDVPLNSTITINFSEAVNTSANWFSLVCASSGNHTAVVTGGPTSYTLTPEVPFVEDEICTLTVLASNVTDVDAIDPPDNMSVNFTAGFTSYAPPQTIGEVNGAIVDGLDATKHESPYKNQTVKVQGVIYEKTLQATTGSSTYKGFFLQNTQETADGDPLTSDGIFVYMKYDTTIGGTYQPQVGDEIILTAKVTEYYNMTELAYPYSVNKVVRQGVNIDAEVAPVVADPPVRLADANIYWERLQGMRIQAPQNSLVMGGRSVFSPADAEIWLARNDSSIALRTSEYERRAFRDSHPLDDNYDPTSWDGNGYRILIGSWGIKGTTGDAKAMLDPANTFETLTNAPAGGLNYTYSKYRIEISEQPAFAAGVDPSLNNPPSAVNRAVGYSIVDYNLENLYDYRNNPASACDFAGDLKCVADGVHFMGDVKPPYDYVPASDAAYQARLNDISLEIINDLHSPDVMMVQEVENQDICSVDGASMNCTIGDGKPDVLQDVALKVASLGGPAYDAAYDPDSSDLRGIAPAFLYRTDRVQLLSPVGDPILGTNPAVNYAGVPVASNNDVSNPKTFNAVLPVGFVGACEAGWVFPRAPDVALFRIYTVSVGTGQFRDIYAINNHFKSGPDTCVAHRTEQAKYNAALVAFIQQANPEARIVVAGDFNVYPRPDDTSFTGTDQLGSLYDPALGLKNLWENLLAEAPEAAYSYVYLGMAQTLDQMFVNQPLQADLEQFRIAHINSDFAAENPDDVARGTSDHDPNVANFNFNTFNWSGFFQPVDNLPELNVAKAGSAIPVKFSLDGDQGLSIFKAGYPKSSGIVCDANEPQDGIEQTVTAGSSSLQYDPLTGQYTYVWKTDKTWAGTCRRLTVRLSDGMYYNADFKFTK